MKITYIGFGNFHRHAGMKQLYHFAQEVCRQGHEAQILIPGKAETVRSMKEPPLAEIVEISFLGPFLMQTVRQTVKNFNPDIIHVWTPRFLPALTGLQLAYLTGAKIIVDHEDDEDYHLRYMYNSWSQNWRSGLRSVLIPFIYFRNTIMAWVQPIKTNLKTNSPRRGAKEFLTHYWLMHKAIAHTAISPNLTNWVKKQWPNKPVYLLYPGANLDIFRQDAANIELRDKLGITNKKVLVYTGTMSLYIFQWFMRFLQKVKEVHTDAFLVLVGEDSFRIEAQHVADEMGLASSYHLIGQVPYSHIPNYLGLAHVLVQHPIDQANYFRLPAKLPEYLAMGKPIVTFAAGIGESLDDGVHVRKVYSSDPSEAAAIVVTLLDNQQMREQLGFAARAIACERFDWHKNGAALVDIYKELLSI